MMSRPISFILFIVSCTLLLTKTAYPQLQFRKQIQKIPFGPNVNFTKIFDVSTDTNGILFLATDHGLYYYNGIEILPYHPNLTGNDMSFYGFAKQTNEVMACPQTGGEIINVKNALTLSYKNYYNTGKLNNFFLSCYMDRLHQLHYLTLNQDNTFNEFLIKDKKCTSTQKHQHLFSFYYNLITINYPTLFNDSLRETIAFNIEKEGIRSGLLTSYLVRIENKLFSIQQPLKLFVDLNKVGIKGIITQSLITKKNQLILAVEEGTNGIFLVENNQATLLSSETNITGLAIDDEGNLFISTYNNGLYCIRHHDLNYNTEIYSPAFVNLMEIAMDKDGNFVLSQGENGITIVPKNQKEKVNFLASSSNTTCYLTNQRNSIFTSFKKGIYEIDGDKINLLHQFEDEKSNYYYRVFFSQNNNFLITTTSHGFDLYDANFKLLKSFDSLFRFRFFPSTLPDCYYISTEDNIFSYQIGNKSIQQIAEHLPSILSLISFNNSVYFLTKNSIVKTNTSFNTFHKICSTNDKCMKLLEYKDHIILLSKEGYQILDTNGRQLFNKNVTENEITFIKNAQIYHDKLFLISNKVILIDTLIVNTHLPITKCVVGAVYYAGITIPSTSFRFKSHSNFEANLFFSNLPTSARITYDLVLNTDTILQSKHITQNALSIFNLKPGKYQAIIRFDGNFLTNYYFAILPLWYQKKAFQFVVAVLSILLIVFITRYIISSRYQQKIKQQVQQNTILTLESSAKLNQLKPHFVFNLLAPLQSYLIEKEYQKGLDFLYSFSGILRKMIQIGGSHQISLEKEIDFITEYLKIRAEEKSQRLTFTLNTSIPEMRLSQIHIPVLLIQPLIENSVNYGRQIKNHIEISMVEKTPFIEIVISDSGEGFDVKKIYSDKSHSAIQIIQERLAILKLPGHLSFEHKNNLFFTYLKIPYWIHEN